MLKRKGIYAVWCHLHEGLEEAKPTCRDRLIITLNSVWRGWPQRRGVRWLSGEMEMFSILTWEVIIWVHYSTVHLRCIHFTANELYPTKMILLNLRLLYDKTYIHKYIYIYAKTIYKHIHFWIIIVDNKITNLRAGTWKELEDRSKHEMM